MLVRYYKPGRVYRVIPWAIVRDQITRFKKWQHQKKAASPQDQLASSKLKARLPGREFTPRLRCPRTRAARTM